MPTARSLSHYPAGPSGSCALRARRAPATLGARVPQRAIPSRLPLPWEGAWDDALVLCPPQAPASGAALAGTAAATAREGERKTGGELRGSAEGGGEVGEKEQRGRESLSCAAPPPHRSPAGSDSGSPSTPSPSSSPPSLPTLPPERVEREPQPQHGRGRWGEAVAVGVCVCVKGTTSRSAFAGGSGRRGFSLQQQRRQRQRLPESRREDAQSHGALVLGLVLLFGHRQCGPGGREPCPGLLDRRLQQGCFERFLRGGVGAGTVRRGAAGWGVQGCPGPGGARRPAR